MSRRAGKRMGAALDMYKYLMSVPAGKIIKIKKTKGALWFYMEDEVKELEINFVSFDELEQF